MSAKPSVADSPACNNSEKTDNTRLTEKPQGATLENVPGSDTRHDVKQTNGGNVEDTQPPAMSGFFVPATLPGDSTKLSGVARNKTPRSGNTCSVSIRTLNGSRQPYNCQNVKQSNEVNAMQTANTHATATPVAGDKGLTATPGTQCLKGLTTSTLLEAITQAKQERAATGKGNAYGVLLEAFHRAILPAFFIECEGNLSEVSRLLGIHRESVRKYAAQANINTSSAAAAGGVL